MYYIKIFNVVYEKIVYKNKKNLVKTYELTENFIYLHKIFL
jgi:hypothetical protein